MKYWPLGVLMTDGQSFKFVPIRDESESTAKAAGRIVDPPTPRDDRIAKEEKKDVSLDGTLKRVTGKT